MLAQTAGWFCPFCALLYYPWWIGMRRAGFWLSVVPAGLLAYATLMMGGTVQTGTAYLSVLSQAKAVAAPHSRPVPPVPSKHGLCSKPTGGLPAIPRVGGQAAARRSPYYPDSDSMRSTDSSASISSRTFSLARRAVTL